MNSFITKLLFSIAMLLSGCAGTMSAKMEPLPLYGQEIKSIEDLKFIASRSTNFYIAGGAPDSVELDEYPMLMVFVKNDSEEEIHFSTKNIRAAYDNRPIHVYSDKEFEQYLKWRKAMEMRSPSVSVSPANGTLFALSYLTASVEIAARFDDIIDNILRDKTIQPGEMNGGLIILQKLSEADIGKPLILLFKVGSEFHEIRFLITKG